MESSQIKVSKIRKMRAMRTRKRVRGSREKPRLCVIKSNKNIHVQLIDDENALTLASTSTLSKDFRTTEFNKRNLISAKQLGLKIAELAKGKAVKKVVFDRSGFKYHGVIAAVADGAREGGLEF
ncbi:MAG: 50S ribosomal protein L18 [Chlamydiales bacterium]|nr:50S ribosomal protein L18 [Chlamydiales bacterium]